MMADFLNFPRAPGDTRTDEERAAIAERFSYDPSEGSIAFNPDGSFDWPSGWSLDRKIREVDFSRRGGDPNESAAPLGKDDLVDRMVEALLAEYGDIIYAKIKAMQNKNDTKIKNFLEWEANEKAISETNVFLYVIMLSRNPLIADKGAENKIEYTFTKRNNIDASVYNPLPLNRSELVF